MKKLLLAGVTLLTMLSTAYAICDGPPTGDPDDVYRKGFIALDVSLEQAVLGRSNPVAEHAASEAIAAAGVSQDWCRLHAVQDAELARQKAAETPEEQARIAAMARELAALAHKKH